MLLHTLFLYVYNTYTSIEEYITVHLCISIRVRYVIIWSISITTAQQNTFRSKVKNLMYPLLFSKETVSFRGVEIRLGKLEEDLKEEKSIYPILVDPKSFLGSLVALICRKYGTSQHRLRKRPLMRNKRYKRNRNTAWST